VEFLLDSLIPTHIEKYYCFDGVNAWGDPNLRHKRFPAGVPKTKSSLSQPAKQLLFGWLAEGLNDDQISTKIHPAG
jgi:hypothetical protein